MSLSWNLTEQTLPYEQYLPKEIKAMQDQYEHAVKPKNSIDHLVAKTAGNYLAGTTSLIAAPAISFVAKTLLGPISRVAAPFIVSTAMPYLQQVARDVSVLASKKFQSNNDLNDSFEIIDQNDLPSAASIPVNQKTPTEAESYASKAVRMGSEGLFYTQMAGLTQPALTYTLSQILINGGLTSVAGHIGATMAVPFLGPIAGSVGVAIAGAAAKGAQYTWETLKGRFQNESKEDEEEMISAEQVDEISKFLEIFNSEGELVG